MALIKELGTTHVASLDQFINDFQVTPEELAELGYQYDPDSPLAADEQCNESDRTVINQVLQQRDGLWNVRFHTDNNGSFTIHELQTPETANCG